MQAVSYAHYSSLVIGLLDQPGELCINQRLLYLVVVADDIRLPGLSYLDEIRWGYMSSIDRQEIIKQPETGLTPQQILISYLEMG